jgi:glycosyltransferase involved in cell wall biosynthesis
MKKLSLLIAARDEGRWILETVRSALEDASDLVEIIVVDDGSKVPVPDVRGAIVVRNPAPVGLFAAKRLAASLATTPVLLVSDAHCWYRPGFFEAMLDAASSHPDCLSVAQCHGLMLPTPEQFKELGCDEATWAFDLTKAKGTYRGANMVVRRERDKDGHLRIMECVWQSQVKGDGPIPAAMGSCYATTKSFWEKADMLAGLRTWGGQEPDLSLRAWLCGGGVRLVTGANHVHLFRKAAPYPPDAEGIWFNRMRMAMVLCPEGLGAPLRDELAAIHPASAKLLSGDPNLPRDIRRFNEARRPGSWGEYLERFPQIVCERRGEPSPSAAEWALKAPRLAPPPGPEPVLRLAADAPAVESKSDWSPPAAGPMSESDSVHAGIRKLVAMPHGWRLRFLRGEFDGQG